MDGIGLWAGAGGMLLLMFIFLVIAWGSSGGGDESMFGVCSPIRYDSLTSRQMATTRRRIVAELAPHGGFAELAPPAGWRETFPAQEPTPAWHDDGDDFAGWDEDDDELVVLERELVPMPVPVRVRPVQLPKVVEPEAVPVVVNWTAARFSALEVIRH